MKSLRRLGRAKAKVSVTLLAVIIVSGIYLTPLGFGVFSHSGVSSSVSKPVSHWAPVHEIQTPETVFMIGRVNIHDISGPGTAVTSGFTSVFSALEKTGPSPLLSQGPPPFATFTSDTLATVQSSFDGLNELQSQDGFPPDPILAVGPSHVVEMVNSAGEIFDHQGNSLSIFGLSSFFKTGVDFISDPKVLYDIPSGRFFASITACEQGGTCSKGNVTIAVSTSNDPTGSWNVYNISGGGLLADQPIIGLNDDKFVASANMYSDLIGGSFAGAQYWVLNKSQLVAGASQISTVSFGPDPTPISIHPAQSLSSTSTLYMVSSANASEDSVNNGVSDRFQLFSISGVPPSVTVQVAFVPSSRINQPVQYGVGQKGTNELINTDDMRVQDAVWSNGKLWIGLNDGCEANPGSPGASVCVRLSQVSTSGPSLLQDFDVGTGSSYYYPALRIDANGNLGVIAGYSDGQTYPSLAITGQAYNAPANTVAHPVTLKAGSAPDTTSPPRYGDYFGAGLDPSDQTILWVVGEYHSSAVGSCESFHTGSGNCWSTFIGSIKIGDFSLSASPSTLNIAEGSRGSSTITVTSKSGFSGTVSLSASAPSGVIASLNPTNTNITPIASGTSVLNVTANAPAGNYTVTVQGNSAGISRAVNVTVRISDFSISAPRGINCRGEGQSCSYTVTVTSVNGFAGTVFLSITAKPAGTTGTVSPTSVTLTPGGTATARITITPPASGNVTVQGSSGNSTHSYTTHITLYF